MGHPIDVIDLRSRIVKLLAIQGIADVSSSLTREQKRDIHSLAKIERLYKHRKFLIGKIPTVKKYMIDGVDIDVEKISPTLRIVTAKSEEEVLFKWWNLAWWSLPFERAYGRQMRFIVWDEYHNAPMGLIGLQSPILKWKARDEYLGIGVEKRDFWVNQSMSAQRLGALPPYNYLLGGKLVGMMMTADTIQNTFRQKYGNKKTEMKKRVLPADLLFITTTGAFGKSSVYDRLKFDGTKVAEFIGLTKGNGSFHIPNEVYEELIGYLDSLGYDTRRGYGSGPSTKMKLIGVALSKLGLKHGSQHGMQRAVYLFPLASNLKDVVANNVTPVWYRRNEKELADFWKVRWAIPRATRDSSYKYYVAESVIESLMKELKVDDAGK